MFIETKIKRNRKELAEKGVGLLETLFVLAVVAVIITMTLRYYEHYQKNRELSLFQSSVAELMNALNQYYFMNCRQDPSNFTGADLTQILKNQGLIGDIDDNPWGNFSASILNISSDSTNPLYVLRVIASINKTDNNIALADYLRGALNADSQGTGTVNVTWTRLPLYTKDDLTSHQWIMDQHTGQNFIPGRIMTAVNTGTDSKLWIANTYLQSFAKKFGDARQCPN